MSQVSRFSHAGTYNSYFNSVPRHLQQSVCIAVVNSEAGGKQAAALEKISLITLH